jgi:hypothetical protein
MKMKIIDFMMKMKNIDFTMKMGIIEFVVKMEIIDLILKQIIDLMTNTRHLKSLIYSHREGFVMS